MERGYDYEKSLQTNFYDCAGFFRSGGDGGFPAVRRCGGGHSGHISESVEEFKIPNLQKLGLANLHPIRQVEEASRPMGTTESSERPAEEKTP